ncbi:acyltransferase family protein [Aeromonas allosaccharophila]|uniref:acyltransferase family protein n=1 Tax=Aeromonas allosaccharophila TaxID=656 RepID=UPI00214AE279|nr:acyltransferase family protein [Aeromonas allosaccharophila]
MEQPIKIKGNLSRDIFVDQLKGLAILLVVFGHSLQTTYPDFDNNIYFRIIYSFHMPLFMFISGWVATYSNFNSSFYSFAGGKFKRLVVPFLAWYLISYYVNQSNYTLDEYLLNLVKSPDFGLWFLWVLFLCHMTLFLSKKLASYIGDYHLLLALIAVSFIPMKYFGFELLKWQFQFFFFGYFIGKNIDFFSKRKYWILTTASILFPFLSTSWHRLHLPTFMVDLRAGVYSETLLACIDKFYSLIVPLSGIGFTFVVAAAILALSKRLANYLAWIGLFTMDIYAIHFYFLGKVSIGGGSARVLSMFLFALSLSILVSKVIRKSTRLTAMLFGENIKRPLNTAN